MSREKCLSFPKELSWKSPDALLVKQILKAEEGIVIFKDLDIQAPMTSIQKLYEKMYRNPEMIQRLNDVYASRGLFKEAAFNIPNVDQKVPFDLSPTRLRALLEKDSTLVEDLGDEFASILHYYEQVRNNMITRLIGLAAQAIGGFLPDEVERLMDIHKEENHNYRLVDYFSTDMKSRRCGEHRDYGTFSLIFQDGNVGGLQVLRNGEWQDVPTTAPVIFLWGCSAAILSNGRLQAPLHRVVPVLRDDEEDFAARRYASIFFVAPDLDAKLSPVLIKQGEKEFGTDSAVADLTVRDLKTIMGRTWRHREGTLTPEEQAGFLKYEVQNDDIQAFLNGDNFRVENLKN